MALLDEPTQGPPDGFGFWLDLSARAQATRHTHTLRRCVRGWHGEGRCGAALRRRGEALAAAAAANARRRCVRGWAAVQKHARATTTAVRKG